MDTLDSINAEYNEEPVMYCKDCLSLKIRDFGYAGSEYCDECGSSSIDETDIYTWDELYKQRYNKQFVTRGKPKKLKFKY